jgi:hypothetical protein
MRPLYLLSSTGTNSSPTIFCVLHIALMDDSTLSVLHNHNMTERLITFLGTTKGEVCTRAASLLARCVRCPDAITLIRKSPAQLREILSLLSRSVNEKNIEMCDKLVLVWANVVNTEERATLKGMEHKSVLGQQLYAA